MDESTQEGELATSYVVRVATGKGVEVCENHEVSIPSDGTGEGPRGGATEGDDATAEDAHLVLAADTVVALEGEILGKPASDAKAEEMLLRMSGKWHKVHTGIALLRQTAESAELVAQELVTTEVRFRTLSLSEVESYVRTGEPRGKAGSYAVQGGGALFVAEIEGSLTNVIGLPLEETLTLLHAHQSQPTLPREAG